MICYVCSEITSHASAVDGIFLCKKCLGSIIRVKEATGKYGYICVYQEWHEIDSCHERLVEDPKHEKEGRFYANSLICPKGHVQINIAY